MPWPTLHCSCCSHLRLPYGQGLFRATLTCFLFANIEDWVQGLNRVSPVISRCVIALSSFFPLNLSLGLIEVPRLTLISLCSPVKLSTFSLPALSLQSIRDYRPAPQAWLSHLMQRIYYLNFCYLFNSHVHPAPYQILLRGGIQIFWTQGKWHGGDSMVNHLLQ